MFQSNQQQTAQQQHQQQDNQKLVTFYLDEELKSLNRNEQEANRFITNLESNYLQLTPSLLTPSSAPISPNDHIKLKMLDDEEALLKKEMKLRNSSSGGNLNDVSSNLKNA